MAVDVTGRIEEKMKTMSADKIMKLAAVVVLVTVAFLTMSAAMAVSLTNFVFDGFTSDVLPNSGDHRLAGQAPDAINVPGNLWTENTGWGSSFNPWNSQNVVALWNGDSGYLDLGTRPAAVAAGARFTWHSSGADFTGAGKGISFGFVPSTSGGPLVQYGFLVDSNGLIKFYDAGSLVSSLAYQGTWTKTDWHTLSFDITGGNLGNVLFDGTSYAFTATDFTAANTKFLTIGQRGDSSNAYFDYAYVDDAVPVPEPATLALLALGALVGLRRRRR